MSWYLFKIFKFKYRSDWHTVDIFIQSSFFISCLPCYPLQLILCISLFWEFYQQSMSWVKFLFQNKFPITFLCQAPVIYQCWKIQKQICRILQHKNSFHFKYLFHLELFFFFFFFKGWWHLVAFIFTCSYLFTRSSSINLFHCLELGWPAGCLGRENRF